MGLPEESEGQEARCDKGVEFSTRTTLLVLSSGIYECLQRAHAHLCRDSGICARELDREDWVGEGSATPSLSASARFQIQLLLGLSARIV